MIQEKIQARHVEDVELVAAGTECETNHRSMMGKVKNNATETIIFFKRFFSKLIIFRKHRPNGYGNKKDNKRDRKKIYTQ